MTGGCNTDDDTYAQFPHPLALHYIVSKPFVFPDNTLQSVTSALTD